VSFGSNVGQRILIRWSLVPSPAGSTKQECRPGHRFLSPDVACNRGGGTRLSTEGPFLGFSASLYAEQALAHHGEVSEFE
jgi:hypothetical protein